MINSFMQLRKPISNKQKLQKRIRSSVLNLIIDRDMGFIKVARERNTNIIVSDREDYLEEFTVEGKRYVSIPSGLEDKLSEMNSDDAENFVDNLLRFATTKCSIDDVQEVGFNSIVTERKNNNYLSITGKELNFNSIEYRKRPDDNKQKRKDKKEAKDSDKNEECSLTERGLSNSSDVDKNNSTTKDYKDRQINYEFKDSDIESNFGELNLKENKFLSSSPLSEKLLNEQEMKRLANQIVKSFKGRVSKLNTIVPSKKLNAKKLSSDIDDKIYINQKGNNGKHLNMNLIIDMSGSMWGTPVYNAVNLTYLFNEIALQGKLKGSVIWSESSRCVKSSFPMSRDFIKRMFDTGGGEGLLKNLNNNLDDLKSVDTNICITDGDLTDGLIDKDFYVKNKIEIIGVYVNDDAEDLTEYTGSLNRWFSKSLVRRTVEELAEKIVQLGLRKKGN